MEEGWAGGEASVRLIPLSLRPLSLPNQKLPPGRGRAGVVVERTGRGGGPYAACSTTAVNAALSWTARSARTFRLSGTPALLRPEIRRE